MLLMEPQVNGSSSSVVAPKDSRLSVKGGAVICAALAKSSLGGGGTMISVDVRPDAALLPGVRSRR